MRFPYRPFQVTPSAARPSVSVIYRPIIPVRVIGSRGHADILALLDTGADETLFPSFLIPLIGVETDPGATGQVRGVGGQLVTVSYGAVDLELRKGKAHRWSAVVGFLDGAQVAILGHLGFVQYFTPPSAVSGDR